MEPIRTILRTPILAAALAACAPSLAQEAPAPPVATARAEPSAADVAFMQHMIVHHAQAVEMAALVDGRTNDRRIHLLAERIAVSQEDEMGRMRRWLTARGQPVPDAHAHHHGEHAGMAGMATPEEMAALATLRGAAFDRRFLELMIRHHEGALVMVAALFASEDGGQESEIYHFASEVDADQRMEIDRMRGMQDAP